MSSESGAQPVDGRTKKAGSPREVTPPPQSALPFPFGPYTLLKELRRHENHTVYLAGADHLQAEPCPCIIKIVNPETAQLPGFEERFAKASRRLVHLDHRNVAQVFDSGSADGYYFLAQEYITGGSVRETLAAAEQQEQQLPLDLAMLVAVDLLRGMHHALRQPGPHGEPLRLWHGRVTPRRILLSAKGEVKLIDYNREWDDRRPGLDVPPETSTVTSEESLAGTYLAPELVAGEVGGPASDVYAVGMIVRRLLGETFFTERCQQLPVGLHQRLRHVLEKATMKSAAARPRDVTGLLLPLRQALYRLNPRCGPPQLAALMERLVGPQMADHARRTEALLRKAAGLAPVPSERAKPVDAATRTLLLESDEGVRARAVDRVVAEQDQVAGTLEGTRYRILRPIGEGGMGTVYAAEHVDLEKVFALKILNKKKNQDRANVVEGLRREARATSKLGHPNIVSVTDFGETPDGRVFFVMEYLDGRSVGELLDEAGPVHPDRMLPILIQVCEGLGAAHAKGIIHRDIKPDNIFLVPGPDRKEMVKLLDFGVAVHAGQPKEKKGHIAGTPYYMPPEMIRMKELDGRADLYSVGVLAYEALTGARPFGRRPVLDLLRAHLKEEPKPLRSVSGAEDLPPELEAVVMRCLKKEPDARFPDAGAMAKELKAILDQRTAEETTAVIQRPSLVVPPSVRFDSKEVELEIAAAWTEAYSGFLRSQTQRKLRLGYIGLAVAGLTMVLSMSWLALSASSDPPDEDSSFYPAAGATAPAKLRLVHHAEPPDVAKKGQEPAGSEGSGEEEAPEGETPEGETPEGEAPEGEERAAVRTGRNDRARKRRRPPRTRSARAARAVRTGRRLLARGKIPEAEAEFRRALALAKGRHDAMAGLGRAAFQKGNYQKAERFARRALEMRPDSVRYRLDLGAALFRQGRRNDAEVLFRQVLAEHPENEAARRYLQAVRR